MDYIAKTLAELADAEVPAGLHQQIMRRISLYRIRTWLRYPLALVWINLAVTIWYFVLHALENDVPGVVSDLVQGFQVDFSYLQYTYEVLRAVVPVGWFIAMCVNVVLVAITVRFYHKISKQLPKGRVLSFVTH